MSDPQPARPTRRPLWETAAIVLAIASIWPAYVLNLEGNVWKWISYVMLAVMIVVAVRRLRAFKENS